MNDYGIRRTYANLYIHTQLRVLCNIFKCGKDDLRLSTPEEDFKGVDIYFQNTIGIALRVRGSKYDKDICIRLLNGLDGQNELTKIIGGNVDYLLNCVEKKDEPGKLSRYWLFDAHLLGEAARQKFPGIETNEKDGVDIYGTPYHFLAIDIDNLCERVDDILVASGKVETVEPEPFFYKKYMHKKR